MKTLSILIVTALLTLPAMSQMVERLPAPTKKGGMPLMTALNNRATNRSMDPKGQLSEQQLSDLLWAAWGVNRADGRRTAPSAMNKQEIDLYVVNRNGVYVYDAEANILKQVNSGDLRATLGSSEFIKNGDINIVFVADYSKMGGDDNQRKATVAAVDAGFIGQNIYLYSASQKLACVVHLSIDKDTAAKTLKLNPNQHIVLGQTVGIAAK